MFSRNTLPLAVSARQPAGFSIIELLVAVSVIGILASVAVINTNDARARARDVSRKGAVQEYVLAATQYKASRGTAFIYGKRAGGCDGTGNCPDTSASLGTLSWSGRTLVTCSASGCVGYQGGGWGMMTRKGVTGYPAALSIADALVQDGFMSQVRTDPRSSVPSEDVRGGNPAAFNDFIYVICDRASYPPAKPSSAVAFAIYANLEQPTIKEAAEARQHCGGPDTPSGGWQLLAAGTEEGGIRLGYGL